MKSIRTALKILYLIVLTFIFGTVVGAVLTDLLGLDRAVCTIGLIVLLIWSDLYFYDNIERWIRK